MLHRVVFVTKSYEYMYMPCALFMTIVLSKWTNCQ